MVVIKFVLAILLLFTPLVAYGYMNLPITEVYDGDTIKSDFSSRLPQPLNKISIRIKGIDTPEMPAASYDTTGKLNRAKCVKEAELALIAKAFIVGIAEGHRTMKIDNFKWGKYGGRIVGDVKIGGVDIAEALIEAELAVPYDGGTKTHNWCE